MLLKIQEQIQQAAASLETIQVLVLMSKTLKVTGNHVKFSAFLLLPVSEEAKNFHVFNFHVMCLRKYRKHVLCFYQVRERRVKV